MPSIGDTNTPLFVPKKTEKKSRMDGVLDDGAYASPTARILQLEYSNHSEQGEETQLNVSPVWPERN